MKRKDGAIAHSLLRDSRRASPVVIFFFAPSGGEPKPRKASLEDVEGFSSGREPSSLLVALQRTRREVCAARRLNAAGRRIERAIFELAAVHKATCAIDVILGFKNMCQKLKM